MKYRIARGSLSAVWQMMPGVSGLILSLAVVRWHNADAWGDVVSILVVQQIANAALAWGSKDYLQRERAQNPGMFSLNFSNFLVQRAVLIPIACILLSFLNSQWTLAFAFFALGGRFIQQSYDVVVLIERKFNILLLLEILTLCGQVAVIQFLSLQRPFQASDVLCVIFAGHWFKGLVTAAIFHSYFVARLQNEFHLKKAVHFAMLQLSGLLQNKVDILVATQILSNALLGRYQIIMSFLWNIQAGANYISAPYVHHFYRFDQRQKHMWSSKLFLAGILLSALGVAVMFTLLVFAFGFDFNPSLILPSMLFALFSYVNLPWVYQLFQLQKQSTVLLIVVASTSLLAILMFICSSWISHSLIHLLWLMVVHQFATMLLFYSGLRIHQKTHA